MITGKVFRFIHLQIFCSNSAVPNPIGSEPLCQTLIGQDTDDLTTQGNWQINVVYQRECLGNGILRRDAMNSQDHGTLPWME